jgi:hypothetical protein
MKALLPNVLSSCDLNVLASASVKVSLARVPSTCGARLFNIVLIFVASTDPPAPFT